MDEKTRKEWETLRSRFDKTKTQLAAEYDKQIAEIEDEHRRNLRTLDDLKVKALTDIKYKRRASVDTYVAQRREVIAARRDAMVDLEWERQNAYAQFKAEHRFDD